MGDAERGTVTSLASVFPVSETEKAAERVEEAIVEKEKEIEHLNSFISDNTNLSNLVSKLPDLLHHYIMVPFGKAAFFPGRLVHTNEFMVLLGEGYFAERTSKKTVEILKRRGKVLNSQLESLKANIKDLKAEASFFYSTASEAAEGRVEIREAYVENNDIQKGSHADEKKVTVEDDEFARMLSRLDELEKEELAAEDEDEDNEDDEVDTDEDDYQNSEDEQTGMVESENEREDEEHTEDEPIGQCPLQNESQVRNQQQHTTVQSTGGEMLSNMLYNKLNVANPSNCTGLTMQALPEDPKKSIATEKTLVRPAVEEGVDAVSSSSWEAFTSSIMERGNIATSSQRQSAIPSQKVVETPIATFDSSKAFTGSIVERDTMQTAPSQASQSSRPVSRFMQRRQTQI